MREIFCSTGAYIGRANEFDPELIPFYGRQIHCDGFEFMVVSGWERKPSEIVRSLGDCGMVFRTLHSDKLIGQCLSEGKDDDAMALFDESLRAAVAAGAEKMVLHMWGGVVSDSCFAHNLTYLPRMVERCGEAGVTLCVENVPCACGDPIAHWRDCEALCSDVRFIYDTRFGYFAGTLERDVGLFSDAVFGAKTVHMHVSDFTGVQHDFHCLRPIPMPGEGSIDFDSFFAAVKPIYSGTVTLESPSLDEHGHVDPERLSAAIEYIRQRL